MKRQAFGEQRADVLFELPCACQNLRRLSRVVTRIYDQELRRAGLEITQFGLLTALAAVGEARTATAARTWRRGLEKHEADGLSNDGSWDAGVMVRNHIDVYTSNQRVGVGIMITHN